MRSLLFLLLSVALVSGTICGDDVNDVDCGRQLLELITELHELDEAGRDFLPGRHPRPGRPRPPPTHPRPGRPRPPPTHPRPTTKRPRPTTRPTRPSRPTTRKPPTTKLPKLGAIQRIKALGKKVVTVVRSPTGQVIRQVLTQVMTEMGPRIVMQWFDNATGQPMGSSFVERMEGPHPPPTGDVLADAGGFEQSGGQGDQEYHDDESRHLYSAIASEELGQDGAFSHYGAHDYSSLLSELNGLDEYGRDFIGIRPRPTRRPPTRGTRPTKWTRPTKGTRGTKPPGGSHTTRRPPSGPTTKKPFWTRLGESIETYVLSPTGQEVIQVVTRVATDMGARIVLQWYDRKTRQPMGSSFVDHMTGTFLPPTGDVLNGMGIGDQAPYGEQDYQDQSFNYNLLAPPFVPWKNGHGPSYYY